MYRPSGFQAKGHQIGPQDKPLQNFDVNSKSLAYGLQPGLFTLPACREVLMHIRMCSNGTSTLTLGDGAQVRSHPSHQPRLFSMIYIGPLSRSIYTPILFLLDICAMYRIVWFRRSILLTHYFLCCYHNHNTT